MIQLDHSLNGSDRLIEPASLVLPGVDVALALIQLLHCNSDAVAIPGKRQGRGMDLVQVVMHPVKEPVLVLRFVPILHVLWTVRVNRDETARSR